MEQYGVITEQNDLGLGFDPLNPSDNKQINENQQQQQDTEKNGDK